MTYESPPPKGRATASAPTDSNSSVCTQLRMFSARSTDPVTSHLAAEASPGRSQHRARVLAAHRANAEGLADFELVALLPGLHPGSIAKRRKDLVDVGLIVATAETRLTPHGRSAIVWTTR